MQRIELYLLRIKPHVLQVYAILKSLWKSLPQRIADYAQAYQRARKNAPGQRYKKHNHSSEDEHRTAEQHNWRRQNILSLFTVIFAFAAVVFAFKTFVETRRQANIAQAALQEVRDGSAQTERSVVAAEQSAKAAMTQVEVSRNAAMEELRPYVWIRLNDVPRVAADNTVSIRRRYSNTGKSAALNTQRVTHTAFLTFLPGGESGWDVPYPSDEEVARASEVDFIAPGAERSTLTKDPKPISPAIWDNVRANKGLYWVDWGTVRYMDIYGKAHHLWFCNTWDGQSEETLHCPRGNRID